MSKVLTENTLIPISAITIVFGAALWLTSIYKQGEVNAQQITEIKNQKTAEFDKLEQKIDRLNEKIDRVLERLK
jgi:TolA-binding protein